MERPIDQLLRAISGTANINLHLLDIENLAGTGKLSTSTVKRIQMEYLIRTECSPNDLYLIAAGPQNKMALFHGWHQGTTLYQFRKGKDGADFALVNLFSQIEHPEQFSRLFLASGDGELSAIASRAKDAGLSVTVVTGIGRKSRRLMDYKHLKLAI